MQKFDRIRLFRLIKEKCIRPTFNKHTKTIEFNNEKKHLLFFLVYGSKNIQLCNISTKTHILYYPKSFLSTNDLFAQIERDLKTHPDYLRMVREPLINIIVGDSPAELQDSNDQFDIVSIGCTLARCGHGQCKGHLFI